MTRPHDMGGRFGDGPIPIKVKANVIIINGVSIAESILGLDNLLIDAG